VSQYENEIGSMRKERMMHDGIKEKDYQYIIKADKQIEEYRTYNNELIKKI
jgi:hypothetical protein